MDFNGRMNGGVLLYSLMKKASIVVFISNGMFGINNVINL